MSSIAELKREILGQGSRKGTVIQVLDNTIKVSTNTGISSYPNPGNVVKGDSVTIVDNVRVLNSTSAGRQVFQG